MKRQYYFIHHVAGRGYVVIDATSGWVAAFKDQVSYVGRSKMRLAIKLAAAEGWSFGKLWDEHDWSAPKLGREVEDMRIRGYIPQHALFVPHYVYQRRKSERALMEVHAEDARQLDMFDKKVH